MKHSLLIACMYLAGVGSSMAQDAIKGEIENFSSQTGSSATVDKATSALSILRFPAGRAFPVSGTDVQQKSINFLNQNTRLYGLRAGQDGHRFKEQRRDVYGFENVTLQQTYKGVPVFDGLLRFHYNTALNLTSVNGNFIPEIKVNPVPTLAQHEAESLAIKSLGTEKPSRPKYPLKAYRTALYIFQKGLAQGYNGSRHLAYEVEVRDGFSVREFVYIDAHTGDVIEKFTGTHSINRKLYEETVSSETLVWQEGNALPGALTIWQESEVRSAGFIYNLMKNTFGRISYDGQDAMMVTINNNPDIECPNANWNGVTANYCDGLATDDVVAHEWAHAYTEYTSGLIYGWQPGALNEAYSDIWGETVDQLNEFFDEGESNSARTACGSSARWQVGEKATAFNGALRDMWNPNCFGSPGKVSDPLYWCADDDEGGVHINSGILNHAYALLVDGGTFNGQTIRGIGLTKAAHIFWLAQSQYMTATTDFAAQADILEAAATSLVGINLRSLTTKTGAAGNSGSIITSSDVVQLSRVMLATEMRSEVSCGFRPLLKPVASLCEGANENLAIFFEDFEDGLGKFTVSNQSSSTSWTARNWTVANATDGRTGKVAYGADFPGGDCQESFQNGVIRLQSPVINIPATTAGTLRMAFDHYIAIEEFWDGGNIKYSINGASYKLLPKGAFTANGYNNVISGVATGNDNPLAGQAAFSGQDEGSVKGSWGQSQIDLSAIGLNPGDNIQFRFELGTDGCGGQLGWYVDDIRVYSCSVTPAVHFATDRVYIDEGQATTPGAACVSYVDKTIAVQIDKAPSKPVTITFKTPTGTAKQGQNGDYTISPASITLENGALSKNVTVRVYNDAYVEGPETINLSYSINANGGDAYAADSMQTCLVTITDDDLEPGNYTEELLSADFNNGRSGWSIINGGNSQHTWTVSSFSDAGLDPSGPGFLFVNSNTTIQASIQMDEIIESPAVNTAGKKNMVITFDQAWLPYDGGFNEQGTVDVWDGSVWRTVFKQDQKTPNAGDLLNFQAASESIAIPDEYANVNMKVRFRFVSRWDYWWAIDNIRLTATNSNSIQTAVNTTTAAVEYLGPNETAVFYDPQTGDLMAKIKNLTSHNYGCTAVAVDRAGKDATSWVGSYHITRKTFKVTPTTNNPNGRYEITLYYKGAELPTFKGSNINSMGKTEGNISAGSSQKTAYASVRTRTAFETDYAFTATFDTGFSGFGLSDSPPAGPLPVTLIAFTGKHTPEGNLLTWSTTSETNNDYFAVERTLNGRDFTEIGRVAGIGNATARKDYRFTDAPYADGTSYYRLKQVDTDGQFAYSQLVAIDPELAGELRFFPNPVQSLLTLEVPEASVTQADIQVLNTAGQEVVVRKKAKAVNGKFSVDLSKLPSGNYQIKVTGDKHSYSRTVFKY
ncbi:M4 family metallopeptidase [Dyadobacter sandarakinus]|uniref:M4 family metallopeptidase n=1 Tax=Dyadobacter sandarakinus TaxID=2747268 RepID=A0ABX7I316_9BACT|nr:M4 family metallopeptidase [Dyadobacter sandarakinus]QRQ99906.1 M4 family metallopeptidase [Dyadobacter sandarakinus]